MREVFGGTEGVGRTASNARTCRRRNGGGYGSAYHGMERLQADTVRNGERKWQEEEFGEKEYVSRRAWGC